MQSVMSYELDSRENGKSVEVDSSDRNSVCSMPKQVEGGKESEVSCEVDSQENEKCSES